MNTKSYGTLKINTMEIALYILLAYYSGMAVAYAIAYRNIKKFKTKDNPWSAAIFSWIMVFAVVVVSIYKLFRKEKI